MAKAKVYITNLEHDLNYKKKLLDINKKNSLFIDVSRSKKVENIRTSANDLDIVHAMQELFITDIDILIVFVSKHKMTKREYTYDWDIAATLNSDDNKKRSVIIILLPDVIGIERVYSEESESVLFKDWNDTTKAESRWNHISYLYPTMPSRLVDNLVLENVSIDIIKWENIFENPNKFKKILLKSLDYRNYNKYNSLRPLFHSTLMK